ncbi:MAG: ribose 5-phosphate isomerase A [Acidimicrobiales bacterium]|jgi:ribose 5-phosphate isomerase A
MTREVEVEKRLAAEAAAELVEDSMTVGLGTGSTVAYLLPALARRNLSLRCVTTSQQTDEVARSLGLHVEAFAGIDHLDIAIDGADQIAPDGWLVKGGGGAHTREKLVAVTAERFIVIADSTKLVERLHSPIPLELLSFGLASTLRRLAPTTLRDWSSSPDGGVIADFRGEVGDPAALAARFGASPGVVEHGLFSCELVQSILIGQGRDVEVRAVIHQVRGAIP